MGPRGEEGSRSIMNELEATQGRMGERGGETILAR